MRLLLKKQNALRVKGFWISLLLLVCAYTNSYSQNTTPLTDYDCDMRATQNGDPCAGASDDCVFPVTVEKGCRCWGWYYNLN